MPSGGAGSVNSTNSAVPHDKHAIAKSFGNAACTYDRVAGLQQRVGDVLLGLLKETLSSNVPLRMLDVGCGTGYLVQRLAPDAALMFALDIAEGMLRFAKLDAVKVGDSSDKGSSDKDSRVKGSARANSTSDRLNVHYICADAEAIPLADNAVDIVVSNFAIQWCPNKRQLFQEVSRVLAPGGRFVFSMPGANTLQELKASWKIADPLHSHVNQFCDLDEVAGEITHSPLEVETLRAQTELMRYHKLQELTHELKALGAHNVTDGRARQLTGKNTLKRLIQAYDNFRDEEGLLPATWNVIYGVLVNNKTG